jgi:hypothetical protein
MVWTSELIKKVKRVDNTISRALDQWFDSTIGGYIIEFFVDIVDSHNQVERYFFKGPRGIFLQFMKLRLMFKNSDLERLMFKNSDNNIHTEAGHTCSGRVFREVHLANLFKKNYMDEGFYSGEDAYLTDEEHSDPAGTEEGKDEELHREEPKTSETTQTIEVSTIVPPVDSTIVRN